RYDGYSWSGAVNEPDDTPAKVCTTCSWQFDGQCCSTKAQLSAEGGSGPSCPSVAEPMNDMTSPTFHVVPAAGLLIVATGAVLPTVMVTVFAPDAPEGSVTRRAAVTVPCVV